MTTSERAHSVLERVRSAGGSKVSVIAVCKGVSPESIKEAAAVGISHFGDNYLQESLLRLDQRPPNTSWHFLGRSQSNKLAKIASSFDVVQTVDSPSVAEKLSRTAPNPIECFIQVNIASEPSKAGILPENVLQMVETMYDLPKVRLVGLMTIGPENQNAEDSRPYFNRMRRLLESLRLADVNRLSMGMTNDFEVAIQEGATDVRIGRAIFGPRNYR